MRLFAFTSLDSAAKPKDAARIAELIHRGMPRPVVVLTSYDDDGDSTPPSATKAANRIPQLSFALTRPSKSEPGATVIESAIRVPITDADVKQHQHDQAAAVGRVIAPDRLQSYLTMFGGDMVEALSLYNWNGRANAAIEQTVGMVA